MGRILALLSLFLMGYSVFSCTMALREFSNAQDLSALFHGALSLSAGFSSQRLMRTAPRGA